MWEKFCQEQERWSSTKYVASERKSPPGLGSSAMLGFVYARLGLGRCTCCHLFAAVVRKALAWAGAPFCCCSLQGSSLRGKDEASFGSHRSKMVIGAWGNGCGCTIGSPRTVNRLLDIRLDSRDRWWMYSPVSYPCLSMWARFLVGVKSLRWLLSKALEVRNGYVSWSRYRESLCWFKCSECAETSTKTDVEEK